MSREEWRSDMIKFIIEKFGYSNPQELAKEIANFEKIVFGG